MQELGRGAVPKWGTQVHALSVEACFQSRRFCPLCYNFPMRFWIFLLLLSSLTVWAQSGKPQSPDSKALHDLFASEWDYDMQQHPEQASTLGDRRWNDRWTDASLEAHARRNQHNEGVLAHLGTINRANLSAADQLNYDLFKKHYEESTGEYKWHWFLLPLNQRGGIQTSFELSDALRFQTIKDYEDWIARLRTFPQHMDQIVPSFKKFKEFFVNEYLPACYDQVGAWQLPHGDELYAFFVRHYTTTDVTPEQVHQIGLREVARIRAQMEQIMQQTGFKGTRDQYFKFLRTDPQFFYKTPEELFEAYKALAKTVDPNLVKVFKTLPREPYGVEAIPASFAPDTTAAYYRPGAADGSRAGTYFVNLYKPDARPKWEMTALSLHESVPGHHLQIARAHELGEMPNFRRYGEYTAFVEGWGLYAESLGEDMGLYDDPYSKFGQLSYEMWRAVRLVVDTGIHVKHWTREQAIKYFMENCPKHELDITNEIDRYIAWPGQALAYKTGELKIKELRARAKERLGTKFDLKEFHDVVLGAGPLPLDILERNVGEWIAKKTQASVGAVQHAASGVRQRNK